MPDRAIQIERQEEIRHWIWLSLVVVNSFFKSRSTESCFDYLQQQQQKSFQLSCELRKVTVKDNLSTLSLLVRLIQ